MRKHSARAWTLAVVASLGLGLAACGDDEETSASGGAEGAPAEQGPIVIGAAVDDTKVMKNFDQPALAAARIRAQEVNASGGVNGRKIEFRAMNTRLDPERTRASALELVEGGADVLWVTCDVDFATPSTQIGISQGKLTVAPCIGTDQMGPKRFGEKGKLAYSFGNVAQDEGAAMAEMAKQQGWTTATLVVDKVIAYTQNVCSAFANRFEENGGKIVRRESFTEGDGTINSVVSKVNGTESDTIAICTTTQKDLPAFVSGVRTGGNETPIMGPWSIDGAFWLPKSSRVADEIYYTTYASVFGDDPDAKVQGLVDQLTQDGAPPATGGFVTGAAAIDGLVAAVKQNGGSTDGAKLAATFEGFKDLDTVSGKVSFSPEFHTAFGREYRVMQVKDGKHRYTGDMVRAGTPAELDPPQ
jgi:branched-chain amino acid transport system substrate-binding protein